MNNSTLSGNVSDSGTTNLAPISVSSQAGAVLEVGHDWVKRSYKLIVKRDPDQSAPGLAEEEIPAGQSIESESDGLLACTV